MNNIKTTEAKIRSLIARLLALFGLALIYVFIEVISFPVMAYITTKYDKTLHTSYDQTSVTTSSGLTYDKASTGRACQYLPQTNTVDPNSCIDAIILAGSVGEGMRRSFIGLLESEADLPNIVCLDSGGGVTKSAEWIAEIIRQRELNTCMADYLELENGSRKTSVSCKSVCPFILLAGHERKALGNTFSIGVHHSGRMMNLPLVGKFAKHTPMLQMLLQPPLKPIVEDSRPQVKEKYMALLERSYQTDLDDMDIIAPEDYSKYAIFSGDGQ